MRCNRCGKPIDENAQYCPHCGSEIIPDSPLKASDGKPLNLLKEYDNQFLNQPKKKPKFEKSKKSILYWLLGILFALFVAAIVCYSLGWSLPEADTSSQSPGTVTQSGVSSSSESGTYYVVTVGKGNRLSFRSEPNENASKLDRIDNGTRLLITEVQDGWGKTTFNNQTGWVCLHNEDGIYCLKE